MTIKELEAELNITRANVRFYEREGLISPKRNPLNDYREYTEQDLEQLRRILFLRKLDISVESLRLLQAGKLEMKVLLQDQLAKLEIKQKENEEIKQILLMLLQKESLRFSTLDIESVPCPSKPLLKDTLNQLWFYWDKLVVWGLMLIQFLYTIMVFPWLPSQIPSYTGQGMIMKSKIHFWFYFIVPFFLVMGYRYSNTISMFYQFPFMIRYREEINAVITIGVIGYYFVEQLVVCAIVLGVALDFYLMIPLYGLVLCIEIIVILTFYFRNRKIKGEQ